MRPHPLVVVVLVAVAMGLLIAVGSGTAIASNGEDLTFACAAEPDEEFSDPEGGNETIGWFDGYWYNEPLELNTSEGLNQSELEKLSTRTAARMEAMRCLPFEELPPIDVIDRDTFAENQGASFEAWDEQSRQFDNKQFEMLLTIGSEVDSVEVRQESQAATVGGYYDYVEKQIVIISDDNESLTIDETVLAHELGHALQDQHFDLGQYDRQTLDRNNGKLGVIEGDVVRLEHDYESFCATGAWVEPCMTDQGPADGETRQPPNFAYYFMSFQPYSDGPAFIEHIYEEGGWEAVNALYDDMPRSSLYTIEPSYYGEVDVAELEVPDQSAPEWDRLTWEDGPDHNVIGQAGISAVFMGQSAESPGSGIISLTTFQNFDETGSLDRSNPFNYQFEETDGWRGDRLYVYTDTQNRTGSVWKTAWENPEEMQQFKDAYEELAVYHGGEAVHGYEDTWVFDESSDFDKVLTLHAEGDRLWIVGAPSIDAIDAIHEGMGPEEAGGDDPQLTPGIPDWPHLGNDDGTPADPDGNGGWFDSPLTGFGLIVALAALFIVAGRYYRHD